MGNCAADAKLADLFKGSHYSSWNPDMRPWLVEVAFGLAIGTATGDVAGFLPEIRMDALCSIRSLSGPAQKACGSERSVDMRCASWERA